MEDCLFKKTVGFRFGLQPLAAVVTPPFIRWLSAAGISVQGVYVAHVF